MVGGTPAGRLGRGASHRARARWSCRPSPRPVRRLDSLGGDRPLAGCGGSQCHDGHVVAVGGDRCQEGDQTGVPQQGASAFLGGRVGAGDPVLGPCVMATAVSAASKASNRWSSGARPGSCAPPIPVGHQPRRQFRREWVLRRVPRCGRPGRGDTGPNPSFMVTPTVTGSLSAAGSSRPSVRGGGALGLRSDRTGGFSAGRRGAWRCRCAGSRRFRSARGTCGSCGTGTPPRCPA